MERRSRTIEFVYGKYVKLSAGQRLYFLGVVMFAALFTWAWYRGRDGALLFLIPLAIAGITYLAAIREFSRAPKLPRHVVFTCLVISILWRIPFFLIPAGPRDDLHRYVWDGRVQRFGYSPYGVIPNDPALAGLHTPETSEMNNPDVSSPYPAGAQLFFRAVTAIRESTFAFKVALLGCDFAIILVLLGVLPRNGKGEHWVLAYAWHPLIATEVAGGGHIDILGVLLLVISIAALTRRWRATAAVAFGLAVAVKFLPIVVAPLYWRRLRIRDALLSVLVVGLLYAPFLRNGRIPTGSLSTYLQRFRFNDPLFNTFERVMSPHMVAGLAVLVGLLAAVWLRGRQPENLWSAWAWPMAVALAFSPVLYPWYLVWLVPFLGAASTLPLMLWSVTILFTYFVWYLQAFGHPWQVPGWIMVLEYGLVLLGAAIILARRSLTPVSAKALSEVQSSSS
jgi:alpha-1,6-mannosyltransferase